MSFTLRSFLLLLIVNLIIIASLGYTVLQERARASLSPIMSDTPTSSATLTLAVTNTLTPTETPPPTQTLTPTLFHQQEGYSPMGQGTIILSITEAGYAHLFAYQPETLQFLRLTAGNWDDIHPAVSPDGNRIAFSSRRNGYWDLFLMDLPTGKLTRLTDTGEYEGYPSWSPDGAFLVCEKYVEENLELFLVSVEEPESAPIRLTADPAVDSSPAWSPQGRQIAFISTRTGEPELWLADLDRIDDRFRNLSQNNNATESHPSWSADGKQLMWSSNLKGNTQLLVWDATQPDSLPNPAGTGAWSAFSPAGDLILAGVEDANHHYLTAYYRISGNLAMPLTPLTGALRGIAWSPITLPDPLPPPYLKAQQQNPAPLWKLVITPFSSGSIRRHQVVELEDINAPYPFLHDMVNEAFTALRQRLAPELGWDYLYQLENAYVPITSPLDPLRGNDWLYTGRAFAVSPVPINAGWMVIVREDYPDGTYWRVFLKTRYQDGSQGTPLSQMPWDLNARYSGLPGIYEQGGQRANPPPGYWVDLTSLAQQFGFERIPALVNWRTYYEGARFNEFVMDSNLDWLTAMYEVYPEEVLNTPTLIPTETPTPTRTPRVTRISPTPTPTRTPTPTSTRRPTWTPSP